MVTPLVSSPRPGSACDRSTFCSVTLSCFLRSLCVVELDLFGLFFVALIGEEPAPFEDYVVRGLGSLRYSTRLLLPFFLCKYLGT